MLCIISNNRLKVSKISLLQYSLDTFYLIAAQQNLRQDIRLYFPGALPMNPISPRAAREQPLGQPAIRITISSSRKPDSSSNTSILETSDGNIFRLGHRHTTGRQSYTGH